MDKQGHSDIATFPALFADLEQFIEEELAHLRRAGSLLTGAVLSGGMLTLYLLEKLA